MSHFDPRVRRLLDAAKHEARAESRVHSQARTGIDLRVAEAGRSSFVNLSIKTACVLLLVGVISTIFLRWRGDVEPAKPTRVAIKGTKPVGAISQLEPAVARSPQARSAGPSGYIHRSPRRQQITSTRPQESPPQVETTTDSLSEELLVLATARAALSRNAFDEARSALDQHSSRFPQGVLTEEREAARVMLACLSSAPTAAEQRARFLSLYPSSVLRIRVNSACGEN